MPNLSDIMHRVGRARLITFRVSRRRREMYIGHVHLLCVCLSAAACPHYCTDPEVRLWLWQHSANVKCQRVLVLAVCLVTTANHNLTYPNHGKLGFT